MSKFLLFVSILFCCSCLQRDKLYYSEESILKMKQLEKNPNFIFLKPKLPNPNWNEKKFMAYFDYKNQIKLNKQNISEQNAKFAIYGRSTANYAILSKKENSEWVKVDSSYCDVGDVLFLKMPKNVEGEYKIKSWGCRYGKEYEILIK